MTLAVYTKPLCTKLVDKSTWKRFWPVLQPICLKNNRKCFEAVFGAIENRGTAMEGKAKPSLFFSESDDFMGEHSDSSERKRKRVVCFIHVPKSAGSSAWTTIANLPRLTNNARIAVADAYADACNELGHEDPRQTPEASAQALRNILTLFRASVHEILFVHYHTPGLPAFDEDLDVDIVILVREPAERWRSGLRHWLGGSKVSRSLVADYPDQTAAVDALISTSPIARFIPFGRYITSFIPPRADQGFPFSFFSSTFSWSADVYLSSAFGRAWGRLRNFGLPGNMRVIAFHTNDLVEGGPFVQFFSREYGLPPFAMQHHEGTVTLRGKFLDAQEKLLQFVPGFSLLFARRIRAEEVAIRRLLEIAGNPASHRAT